MITALLFTFLLGLLVISVVSWSLSERRLNSYNALWLEASNAAEALAEYGISQIVTVYQNNANPQNKLTLTLPPTNFFQPNGSSKESDIVPSSLGLAVSPPQIVGPANGVFFSPNDPSNTFDTSVGPSGATLQRKDITVIAQATAVAPSGGPPVTVCVQETVSVRGSPWTRWALFYTQDLEIFPGPKMDIYGPVGTNGSILLSSQGGTLNFHDSIAVSGNIFHAWDDTNVAGEGSGNEALGTAAVNIDNASGKPINMITNTTTNAANDSTMGAGPTIFDADGRYYNSGPLLTDPNDPTKLGQLDAIVSASFSTFASQTWGANRVQTQVPPTYPVSYTEAIDAAGDLPNPHSLIEPSKPPPPGPYQNALQDVEDSKIANRSGLYVVVSANGTDANGADKYSINLYSSSGSAAKAGITDPNKIGPNGGILLGTFPSNLINVVPYLTSTTGTTQTTTTSTSYAASTSLGAPTVTVTTTKIGTNKYSYSYTYTNSYSYKITHTTNTSTSTQNVTITSNGSGTSATTPVGSPTTTNGTPTTTTDFNSGPLSIPQGSGDSGATYYTSASAAKSAGTTAGTTAANSATNSAANAAANNQLASYSNSTTTGNPVTTAASNTPPITSGMYDQRQQAGIDLVQIDMQALKAALQVANGTSTDKSKAITDASGNVWGGPTSVGGGWDGGIYVDLEPAALPNNVNNPASVAVVNGTVAQGNSLIPTTNGVQSLCISTNAPMYIIGNFNADGSSSSGSATTPDDGKTDSSSTDMSAETPVGLAADAITILSANYFGTSATGGDIPATNLSGTNAYKSLSTKSPAASGPVEIAAAFVTGIVPTGNSNLTNVESSSGGAHNLPRFLESWGGGNPVTIRGSLISMFQSQTATGRWSTAYYGPPARIWGYDQIFANGANIKQFPPNLSYRRLAANIISSSTYATLHGQWAN